MPVDIFTFVLQRSPPDKWQLPQHYIEGTFEIIPEPSGLWVRREFVQGLLHSLGPACIWDPTLIRRGLSVQTWTWLYLLLSLSRGSWTPASGDPQAPLCPGVYPSTWPWTIACLWLATFQGPSGTSHHCLILAECLWTTQGLVHPPLPGCSSATVYGSNSLQKPGKLQFTCQ